MNIGSIQSKIGWVFVIMAFIISGLTVTFSASETQVDVGLVFGANNQYPIGLSSDQGFLFGTDASGGFNKMIDLSNYQTLTFYKDGFFEPELITKAMPYYDNGNVKKGYHLQLGDAMANYLEASAQLALIKGVYPEAYLTLDQGWRIFYGAYLDESEAQIALAQVAGSMSQINVVVAPPEKGRVIVMHQDQIIFAYNSLEQTYVFKATVFELNAIKYRNSCIIKRVPGSDFTVINRVNMSEYLYGVVPKEMGGEWPIEALKAQAIAARNYVLSTPSKYSVYGFDVCSTINSQVYGGYSAEKPLSNQAVDATKRMVLTYEGEIVPLYYHASSGGVTDAAENVWSSALPYVKSTLDPYSLNAPNADWTLTLSKADIEVKLIVAGYNVGALKSVRILERAPSGRVMRVEFVGSNGSARLEKDKIRSILGSTLLKSMLFSFEPTTVQMQTSMSTPTQSTALTNQNIEPVFVRSNEGIFSKLIGSNQVSIEGMSGVVIKAIDINALRTAKDIYSSTNVQNGYNIYAFKSTEAFDITGSNVVFYGHGYGHGLGMSQWGAKKMAENGMTYQEILKHYFVNTQLSSY